MVAASAAYHVDEDELFAHLMELERNMREFVHNANTLKDRDSASKPRK